MKTTRILVVSLLATMAFVAARSQTVDFLVVSKVTNYTQTDNSTTTATANPWSFDANIEGTNLSLASLGGIAPTMTSPLGGTGSTTLVYNNVGGDSWQIHHDYSSQALLDAAYANGDYGYTILGQTVSPISLTGNSYPVAPIATDLSGGTISGGILMWDRAQALTITLSGSGIDHMGIDVFGTGFVGGFEDFGVGTVSFTIPGASLIAGQGYTVQLAFDDIVGGTAPFAFGGSGGMSGAQYAGVYNTTTSFTIQAIPEPSAFVAIAGAVALGGVMAHRRRRQIA